MAYIKDDNKEKPPVSGPNPFSTGGESSAPTSQGAQSGTQPNQQNLQQQVSTGNAGANKKAASGAFTNVQNYVEKNKPQTQKLAQTATQDMTKRAQDIRQAVQEKNQQQQQQLSSEQAKINQQMGQAGSLVNDMMGFDYYQGNQQQQAQAPQPTPQPAQGPITTYGRRYVPMSTTTTPEADANVQLNTVPEGSAERNELEFEAGSVDADFDPTANMGSAEEQFASLMRGPTGVNQVSDLAISDELSRAKALANLAGNVNREGQRRAMLAQTLGGSGYTAGQSRLDDMILSRDKEAMQQLAQDTKQSTEGLQDYLTETGKTSAEALGQFRDDYSNFGEKVTGIATGAGDTLQRDIEKAYQEELRRRQALLGQFDKDGNFIGDSSDYFTRAREGGLNRLGDIDYRIGDANAFNQAMLDHFTDIGRPMAWDDDWYESRQFLENTPSAGYGTNAPAYSQDDYDAMTARLREEEGPFGIKIGEIIAGGMDTALARASDKDLALEGYGVGTYGNIKDSRRRANARARNAELYDKEFTADDKDLFGFREDADYSENPYINQNDRDSARATFYDMNRQLRGMNDPTSLQNRIQSYIADNHGVDGLGMSYADLASGKDLNRYQTSDQSYLNRVNALNRLLGRDTLSSSETEGRGGDVTDEMMRTLKRYEDLG